MVGWQAHAHTQAHTHTRGARMQPNPHAARTCEGDIFWPLTATQASSLLSALTISYGTSFATPFTSLSLNLRPIRRFVA